MVNYPSLNVNLTYVNDRQREPLEPVIPKPLLTRERLAELERILERLIARQRTERERDQPARQRVLLDEGDAR